MRRRRFAMYWFGTYRDRARASRAGRHGRATGEGLMTKSPAPPIVPPQTAHAETTLGELLRAAPIPDDELAQNAALFMAPRTIKRMFFLDEIYRACLPVHGVILQFGVRWGR